MNVVYTFDDGYTEITGVSLVSLLENNRNENSIAIYVIDCGIKDDSKEKLIKICDHYKRTICFIKAVNLEERIGFSPKSGIWSPACYVRLFYAELLPNTLGRVLHVDSDTLIRGSLSDIYDTKFDDKFCAACYDCTPKPKRQAGLKPDIPYVSNGLILINLEKWRRNNVGDRFVNYIKENKSRLTHLDQDVLNGVFKNDIKILPAKYNMMPVTLMYNSLCVSLFSPEQPYYSELEIKEAVKDPVMIHFTGCIYTRRPWDQPCNHWYNKEWIDYYKLLDYSKTGECLKLKKRRFLHFKQLLCKSALLFARIPIVRDILFFIDCKYIYGIDK